MITLVDTHCHIHDPSFFNADEAELSYQAAQKTGVAQLLCVGTSTEDSKRAIQFSAAHDGCFASVGIHPHEAMKFTTPELTRELQVLAELVSSPQVRAIGECGLDFYYNDRPTSLAQQRALLEGQIAIALAHDLPLSFHVREAFEDFWPILDSASSLRGVVHSFTDTQVHLEKALTRGLLIGVNGIATFTTHSWQRDLYKTVPLNSIILETDAPFLTPKPKRGTINTPENVIYITKYLAELRNESEETVANATTANAISLFNLE